jgi:hypothetical protein
MRANQLALLAGTLAVALAALPANAQQDEGDEMMPGEGETDEGETGDDAFLGGEDESEEQQALEAPATEADTGRYEDPETPYFSVGPRFRWIMVPNWFISMFGVDIMAKGGVDHLLINQVGVGAEFTYRKDAFDITAAIWWAGLAWDGGISFKGSDEDAGSWEVVTNDMSSVLFTVDFIWSSPISDWFAITYGAGLGFGIPIGDIVRTEASQASEGLERCTEGQIGVDEWCVEGEEYGELYEKIKVVPWINFLAGMRFKPHRHVAIYVDTGFGIGFQLGVRGGYIF